MKSGPSIPNAIRWHEGMLLAPQHFQQQSARFEALVQFYASVATPFGFGVCNIKVDAGLLDHRIFRLQLIEAVMPDGQYLAVTPPHLDLAPYKAEAERQPVRVYLCVPEMSVAQRTGAMARAVAAPSEPAQDLDPEADEGQTAVPIPRLQPNVRLVAGEAGTGGYTRLPVAEIEYVDSAFHLTSYVPPHFKVSSEEWCRSVIGPCQSVARKVRSKANYLLEMIRSPVGSSNRPRFEQQLHSLMAGLPLIDVHLQAVEVHPYTLYTALCSLAANVAAVASVEEIPRYPRYDHENIAEIFEAVARATFAALDLGVQESFTEFRLDGEGHYFSIPFRQEWVGRKIVLGLLGEPVPDIVNWGEDCYIGSESHIEIMSKNRDVGARRARDDQHEGLRRRPGTILFTLAEDLRRIEPGEVMHVFNPVYGGNDPAPTRVLLYVKHAS